MDEDFTSKYDAVMRELRQRDIWWGPTFGTRLLYDSVVDELKLMAWHREMERSVRRLKAESSLSHVISLKTRKLFNRCRRGCKRITGGTGRIVKHAKSQCALLTNTLWIVRRQREEKSAYVNMYASIDNTDTKHIRKPRSRLGGLQAECLHACYARHGHSLRSADELEGVRRFALQWLTTQNRKYKNGDLRTAHIAQIVEFCVLMVQEPPLSVAALHAVHRRGHNAARRRKVVTDRLSFVDRLRVFAAGSRLQYIGAGRDQNAAFYDGDAYNTQGPGMTESDDDQDLLDGLQLLRERERLESADQGARNPRESVEVVGPPIKVSGPRGSSVTAGAPIPSSSL
jgi:hypothetical protein